MLTNPQLTKIRNLSDDFYIFDRLLELVQQTTAEQTASYQAVLDHLPLAIVSMDAQFQIETWNQAATRLYGWKSDRVNGQSYAQYVPTRYEESRDQIARKFLDEGAWHGHVQQQHCEGYWIQIYLEMILLQTELGEPKVLAISQSGEDKHVLPQPKQDKNSVSEMLKFVGDDVEAALGDVKKYAILIEKLVQAEKVDEYTANIHQQVTRVQNNFDLLKRMAQNGDHSSNGTEAQLDMNRVVQAAYATVDAPTARLNLKPGLPMIRGQYDELHQSLLFLYQLLTPDKPVLVETDVENEDVVLRITGTGFVRNLPLLMPTEMLEEDLRFGTVQNMVRHNGGTITIDPDEILLRFPAS